MSTGLRSLCAISLGSLFLSACGNFDACGNKCDYPKVHDSFCGCQDYSKRETSSGGRSYADCICTYSSGRVGAWFPYRPPRYGDSLQSYDVFASTCTSTTVCELKRDATGEHWDVLLGGVRIDNPTWFSSTNLYGNTIWAVFGHLANQRGSIDLDYTPILFTKVRRTIADLVSSAAFKNTPEACQAACDASSPFCQKFSLEADQTDGLTALLRRLLDRPSALAASELRSMFGGDDDPCGREDTSFTNGAVYNKGEACELRANGEAAKYNAKILVPVILQGNIDVRDGTVFVSFPSPETRAELRFMPEDGETDQKKIRLLNALDAEWGGAIKNVYADHRSVGFSIGDQSCVRVSLR